MIRPIYTYGQPILRNANQTVEADYPHLKALVSDMFDTMHQAEGIGLAAPQIGLSIRLFVIDADSLSDKYPECANFKRVMINPEILESSKETVSFEEGCLSFPGIHEKVIRAEKIRIKYVDEDFNAHEEYLDGFAARVVLHEIEHLEGHVFIDTISPIRKQLIKSKLNSLIKGKTTCKYKINPFQSK